MNAGNAFAWTESVSGGVSCLGVEREFEQLGDRETLASIGRTLDTLTDDWLRLPTDAEQLELLQESVRLGARLQAWQQQLAARIEAPDAVWSVRKTSMGTRLAESMDLAPREAARLIRAGQGLDRFPLIGAAAVAGMVLPSQANAITSVLADLPKEFPDAAINRAQQMMVGFAETHNGAELRRLTAHLVEVLSPETADQIPPLAPPTGGKCASAQAASLK